jgi:hypothetical protein
MGGTPPRESDKPYPVRRPVFEEEKGTIKIAMANFLEFEPKNRQRAV